MLKKYLVNSRLCGLETDPNWGLREQGFLSVLGEISVIRVIMVKPITPIACLHCSSSFYLMLQMIFTYPQA